MKIITEAMTNQPRRRPFINRIFRSPYTFWLHYKVGMRYGHPFSQNVRVAWMLTRVGLKN